MKPKCAVNPEKRLSNLSRSARVRSKRDGPPFTTKNCNYKHICFLLAKVALHGGRMGVGGFF